MNSSLEEYYKAVHLMKYHSGYSLSELDNLMPWEKEIFIGMLTSSIQQDINNNQ